MGGFQEGSLFPPSPNSQFSKIPLHSINNAFFLQLRPSFHPEFFKGREGERGGGRRQGSFKSCNHLLPPLLTPLRFPNLASPFFRIFEFLLCSPSSSFLQSSLLCVFPLFPYICRSILPSPAEQGELSTVSPAGHSAGLQLEKRIRFLFVFVANRNMSRKQIAADSSNMLPNAPTIDSYEIRHNLPPRIMSRTLCNTCSHPDKTAFKYERVSSPAASSRSLDMACAP